MILLDTNIFIEIYRDNVAIISIVDNMQEIAVCDVVRAEMFYGARNKRELQEISADLEELPVLSLLPQVSEMAVNLVKTYCLSHKLELADALIAGDPSYGVPCIERIILCGCPARLAGGNGYALAWSIPSK